MYESSSPSWKLGKLVPSIDLCGALVPDPKDHRDHGCERILQRECKQGDMMLTFNFLHHCLLLACI